MHLQLLEEPVPQQQVDAALRIEERLRRQVQRRCFYQGVEQLIHIATAPIGRQSRFILLAAAALKLTAKDLSRLGVIDDIIPEPLGGAHRDHREMANTLKTYLLRYIRELRLVPIDDMLEARYQKFRRMGVYEQGLTADLGSPA